MGRGKMADLNDVVGAQVLKNAGADKPKRVETAARRRASVVNIPIDVVAHGIRDLRSDMDRLATPVVA